MRIAYQGEPGAYGEEAALTLFGEVETIPCATFAQVFDAVSGNRVDRGIVPVENSQAGSINETYDLLLRHDLVITAEVDLRVAHCLLALPGQGLGQITRVYSHPQALAQCDAYLKRLGVETVPSTNTAGSARWIREQGLPGCAAIASRRAALLYELEVLAEGIETNPHNVTRFLAIGWTPAPVSDRSKTSIVFIVDNRPGTLYGALGAIATRGINLVKIESRPAQRRPWEYVFYVDVDGHAADRSLADALSDLHRRTAFVRVLGSYPRAPHPSGAGAAAAARG